MKTQKRLDPKRLMHMALELVVIIGGLITFTIVMTWLLSGGESIKAW